MVLGLKGHRVKVRGLISAFSHYYLQHNSKMNDPKVFKLGTGNDLGLSYKCCGFGVERLTAIQHGFELCECLLVFKL